MAEVKNRTKEKNDYKKEHYKRVSLEIKKEEYETLKKAAESVGEPVNAFIKKAIMWRLEKGT